MGQWNGGNVSDLAEGMMAGAKLLEVVRVTSAHNLP
jgi:hypothetical protein